MSWRPLLIYLNFYERSFFKNFLCNKLHRLSQAFNPSPTFEGELSKGAKIAVISHNRAGSHYWKGKLSTVDLLVLTSSDQLILILKIWFIFFYKTSNLNEEINCTPSVSVPWLGFSKHSSLSHRRVDYWLGYSKHSSLSRRRADYQESLWTIKLLGSTHVYRKMWLLLYRLYIYAEKQLT